jgi:hypothetical protein
MSLENLRTGEPSRCLIGEGRREEAGQQPVPSHRSGGVGVDSTSASSVRESWESSGNGPQAQPSEQAGSASEAGEVAGEVGVLRSSEEAPVMEVERRRDTRSTVRNDGGRWLRKGISRHEACPHQPWPEVPCGNAGAESNPESRIWEIRPFGSMRGGRASVIGLCLSIRPLLPTLRCASEAGWNAGESPARRVGLFTTEHDRNSAAARRGWKLREMNRRAVMTMNHI